MPIDLQVLPTLVFTLVLLCWFAFAVVLFSREKPPPALDRKREGASIIGLVVQGLSFFIVWSIRRQPFSPIVPTSKPIEVAIGAFAVGVGIFAVVLFRLAVKRLGKEWSVTARLVEGHKLATQGPYAHVRHPIYSSMLGMLLATGLAVSHGIALIAAIPVFFAGTLVRVRSEERLLREAFGADFVAYSRKVPTLIPAIFPRDHNRKTGAEEE